MRLGAVEIERPLVQAGMGGGLSAHELAAAVSEAGGLGTIAVSGAKAIETELAAARGLTERPIAVNLLLPFARRDWFKAAANADVVVTFWGRPRRRMPGCWLHQCGAVGEAVEARSAGADGVIVQGGEAGGHVRGTTDAIELLEQVRARLPADYPVLLAGGIAERSDVLRALEAGATAAVAGTRFLLSSESRAHPKYRQRLLAADSTLVTDLFGAGWPAPHRVVRNAATDRWLDESGRAPAVHRILNRLASPLRRLPPSVQLRLARAQRPNRWVFTPAPVMADAPEALLDAAPLYAGDTVARIREERSAGDLVRALSP